MRHRLVRDLCLVSAFVVLASCGGGGPTGPTASSITINSTSAFLALGQAETFTATLSFSDGTTQAVTGGTWGSDAAAVATVAATTGLVTPVNSGEVTIFVDAQGIRGTKRITVVPNYQGFWTGSYVMTSCTQTGAFVAEPYDLCGLYPVGTNLPVAFNFTQTGGTVSGQTALGGLISGPLTTVAVAGGGLVFAAVYQDPDTRVSQAWQLNITAGQLSGTVVQTWTDTVLTGNAVVGGTLLTVTKSSAQTQSLRPQGTRRPLSNAAAALGGR